MTLDIVGIIEAAYAPQADDDAWLKAVTERLAPSFGGHQSFMSFFFSIGAQPGSIALGAMRDSFAGGKEVAVELLDRVAPDLLRSSFLDCGVLSTLSAAVGRPEARDALASVGVHSDMLGLRANSQAGEGVIFSRPVPFTHRISQRDRVVLPRIAAHLGHALRLRRGRRRTIEAPIEGAAAIFSPSGALAHGEPEALHAREPLSRAVRDMGRACGPLRHLDPEAATELWRTMVLGEWTLIDHMDHDGKRFVVVHAHEGPGVGATTHALSRRERQVVACAAMGHPNKLIAYDLGVSAATVATHLRRAASKLGVTSRASLARRYRELLTSESVGDASTEIAAPESGRDTR